MPQRSLELRIHRKPVGLTARGELRRRVAQRALATQQVPVGAYGDEGKGNEAFHLGDTTLSGMRCKAPPSGGAGGACVCGLWLGAVSFAS